MTNQVVIRFKGPEEWQEQQDNVNKILKDRTGTLDYPSTRSFPPMIFGVELEADAIDELKAINGVVVQISEDG
ncbi:hypothetical protein PENANT_c014G06438 [Penicillium antarcticum]|uniref:Inhibitor I9 domain-containing protein n=1 Tax=Penicillium antarcticum TaxID=416450 RepID=A0A1V6Q5N9_9EURO|nr:uncharacterized protein N7508_009564 [Penicillium antarcticum]KAJ5294743.1 hypothetical protein N7508_009564 [Penicillium antarcticum]OQD84116.1 hypothetical protein PENANT_c014G06438 [Penicillium antarcticum]